MGYRRVVIDFLRKMGRFGVTATPRRPPRMAVRGTNQGHRFADIGGGKGPFFFFLLQRTRKQETGPDWSSVDQ